MSPRRAQFVGGTERGELGPDRIPADILRGHKWGEPRYITIKLPARPGAFWSPLAATGLVGRTTFFELDNHRVPVAIVRAELQPDPTYVEVEMLILGETQ